MLKIKTLDKTSAQIEFNDYVQKQQPVLLKGYVRDWPVVQASDEAAVFEYLKQFNTSNVVDTLKLNSSHDRRFFYNADMSGFNFKHEKQQLLHALHAIEQAAAFSNSRAVAVQSAPISSALPGFEQHNKLDLLDDNVEPRIWLGNAATVPAHYDNSDNLACVVSGKRRFTLFPPEQVKNLYIGPLDFAPTGAAISMIDFEKPDFEKYPCFATALETAIIVDLEPGDVLFIPCMWWHHVEALADVNILVNYWWKGSKTAAVTSHNAYDGLLHCILAIRDLPIPQRKAWQALFDYYVFNYDENNFQHIPVNKKGLLARKNAYSKNNVLKWLINQLQAQLS